INPNINLEGYINANHDVLYGINVDADNPNITISGGYPNNPAAGGLIQYPDYSGTGVPGSQINSNNAAITVNGIRVTGKTQYQIIAATGSIVENSVVDTIGGNPTLLNDQTNAEFLAASPTGAAPTVQVSIDHSVVNIATQTALVTFAFNEPINDFSILGSTTVTGGALSNLQTTDGG